MPRVPLLLQVFQVELHTAIVAASGLAKVLFEKIPKEKAAGELQVYP